MPENKKSHIEMAKQLDELEEDMTSSEADFLDRVLKDLKAGKTLGPKDAAKLELIHEKYLSEGGDEEEEDNDDEGEADTPEGLE